jgi:S-adenosylmethionine synthetase
MARYIANNVVAAGILKRCTLRLYYTVDGDQPLEIRFDKGNEPFDQEELRSCVREVFDLTPSGIIDSLRLKKQSYRASSVYGHFGREDQDLPWDRPDRALQLRDAYGLPGQQIAWEV